MISRHSSRRLLVRGRWIPVCDLVAWLQSYRESGAPASVPPERLRAERPPEDVLSAKRQTSC